MSVRHLIPTNSHTTVAAVDKHTTSLGMCSNAWQPEQTSASSQLFRNSHRQRPYLADRIVQRHSYSLAEEFSNIMLLYPMLLQTEMDYKFSTANDAEDRVPQEDC